MSQLELWRKSWNPFGAFGLTPRSMDRLLEDIYSPQLRQRMEKEVLSPGAEVHETKNMYSVKFDLPGVSKEQIKIDLHENTLTVSGERIDETKKVNDDKKTHLSEVFYGSFSRSFTFPQSVDAEKVEAKFDKGVLTVEIPKKDTAAQRQITIR